MHVWSCTCIRFTFLGINTLWLVAKNVWMKWVNVMSGVILKLCELLDTRCSQMLSFVVCLTCTFLLDSPMLYIVCPVHCEVPRTRLWALWNCVKPRKLLLIAGHTSASLTATVCFIKLTGPRHSSFSLPCTGNTYDSLLSHSFTS